MQFILFLESESPFVAIDVQAEAGTRSSVVHLCVVSVSSEMYVVALLEGNPGCQRKSPIQITRLFKMFWTLRDPRSTVGVRTNIRLTTSSSCTLYKIRAQSRIGFTCS